MAEKKEKLDEKIKGEKKETKKSENSSKKDEVKKEKPVRKTTKKEEKVVNKISKKDEVKKEESETKSAKKEDVKKEKVSKNEEDKKEKTSKTEKRKEEKTSKTEKRKEEKTSKTEKIKEKKTAKKTSKKAEIKEEKKATKASKKENKKEQKTEKKVAKKGESKGKDKKKMTRVYAKSKNIAEEVAATVEGNIEIQSDKPKVEKFIKIEEIKETIKNKKTIPEEEIKKINRSLFRNMVIATGIIIYFLFLNLGHINIDTNVYVTDLKVFSMCILVIAIVLLEYAYRKESGAFAIHGIEMIILAIINMGLIYVNLMLSSRYTAITAGISFIFATYYLIKSIIIYVRKRKKYFVSNMKEIIKEEE